MTLAVAAVLFASIPFAFAVIVSIAIQLLTKW